MVNAEVKRFYDVPTQVAFYEPENSCYVGGIAHGDIIICLCCGATIDIEEFLDGIEEDCPEIQYPIIPMAWCNISDECLGDLVFDASTGEIITD